jgi:hypothetical protein
MSVENQFKITANQDQSEQKEPEQAEQRETAIENLQFVLNFTTRNGGGPGSQPMDVKIQNGKIVEVMEDINIESIIGIDEEEFMKEMKPLIDAGIAFEHCPGIIQKRFENKEWAEDVNGYLYIDKGEINKAIASGKISFLKDEDGYINML